LNDTGDGMLIGLDGLVGVRGEGGRGVSVGSVDGMDLCFDSLASAFSSSLWAMDSQLFERSAWIVVATERAEGGRDPVCGASRTEGGRGTWW